MKLSRIAVAFASLLVASTAGAQSFIPGNQVDDFGPSHYATPSRPSDAPKAAVRVAMIPSNYVDDFGPLVSDRPVAQDEVGAAGGEPGMDAVAAERAKEKAVVDGYHREQYLRSVWAPNP